MALTKTTPPRASNIIPATPIAAVNLKPKKSPRAQERAQEHARQRKHAIKMRDLLSKYKSRRASLYIEDLDHSVLSDGEEEKADWLEGCHIEYVETSFQEEGGRWVERMLEQSHFHSYDVETQTVYIKMSSSRVGFPRACCYFTLAQLNSFIAMEEGISQVCPPTSDLRGTVRYFRGGDPDDVRQRDFAHANFHCYSPKRHAVVIIMSDGDEDGILMSDGDEDGMKIIMVIPLEQITWFVEAESARMGK